MSVLIEPHIIPADPANRGPVINHLSSMLHALPEGTRARVEVREETRSLAQNAYLWAVCYATIVRFMREHHGRDYSDEAIHETLKELFLPSRVEQMKSREVRIYRSTTKLTKREFGEYVEHVQRWAAEFGCVIPEPDWEWKLARQAQEAA